jgi:hypothetical protein
METMRCATGIRKKASAMKKGGISAMEDTARIWSIAATRQHAAQQRNSHRQ